MKKMILAVAATCALLVGTRPADAQSVTEIVIPAGAFAKDYPGIVEESGGYAGTGIQHGTFKFPEGKGAAVVGVTTLVPANWVGEDIDIVFGGSTGGMYTGTFRLIGTFENTAIGTTQSLMAEDNGTTEVVIIDNYTVGQRRFGIAIGRDPDHVGDTGGVMNFEYMVLICVTC